MQASVFGKGPPFFSEKEIFAAISAPEEQNTVCKRCQYQMASGHSIEKTKRQMSMSIATNLDRCFLELKFLFCFSVIWVINKIAEDDQSG